MARLVVINHSLAGSIHELGENWATIGRGDGNTFQLVESSVSGRHCEVRVRDNELVVRDLLSTNGTFIGGHKISEGAVKLGLEDLARNHADDAVNFLAVLEEDHGRDALDVELHWGILVLVGVHLGEGDLASVLLGDRLEGRSHHETGTAPCGPEIDDDGQLGLQHVLSE